MYHYLFLTIAFGNSIICKAKIPTFCFLVISQILVYRSFGQISSCEPIWYEGEGTQYGGVAGGAGGHCGLPVATGDIYHCAMNNPQYAGSEACGSCLRILGPKGEVIVKVVVECPESKHGDVDLATGAFKEIAELKDGRVKIKWQYVPCPLANDIKILFASGSGPYYFKIQIRDAFYPVSKLEYKKQDGSYDSVQRVVYNYFVKPEGIDEDKTKAGPYTFRLTSFTGEVIEATNVQFNTTELVSTGVQFTDLQCPDCAGVINGNAKIDFCNVCSGGTTGIEPNSSCEKDCAGYWNENAYLDACGRCVAGTTGATPCDKDCNGAPGGLAYIDQCGICVGGNTNLLKCKKDCNNEWGGLAAIDSCGICAGGATGIVFNDNKSNCSITGVKSLNNSASLSISPNPFQDYFSLYLDGEFEYFVLDVTGTLIEKGSKSYSTELGISLPKGIYFLKIEGSLL